MLLDQNNREHIIDAFRPDISSSSFQRPVSDMNIASGLPLFCPLSKLDSKNSYIRDDTIFIKAIVDLNRPLRCQMPLLPPCSSLQPVGFPAQYFFLEACSLGPSSLPCSHEPKETTVPVQYCTGCDTALHYVPKSFPELCSSTVI